MPVHCLTFHASYGCRSSGACCTADWPIPIEDDRLARVSAAVADRRLLPTVGRAGRWYYDPDARKGRPALLSTHHSACVFFDAVAGRVCRIHRELGHDALPLSCRQFPRVSILDPRGVSLTLSHYCPTAASLLQTSSPFSVTNRPSAFDDRSEYAGLDVRDAVPPLLRPDMAMDWESWWRCEAHAVDVFSTSGTTSDAVHMVAVATEHLRTWSPSDGPLGSAVDAAWRAARSSVPAAPVMLDHETRLADVLSAIPDEHRPGTIAYGPSLDDGVVRRLVAAHSFANWMAHLGEGLRAWSRSIETVAALAGAGVDVRTIDLLLRHLADPYTLARRWSQNA